MKPLNWALAVLFLIRVVLVGMPVALASSHREAPALVNDQKHDEPSRTLIGGTINDGLPGLAIGLVRFRNDVLDFTCNGTGVKPDRADGFFFNEANVLALGPEGTISVWGTAQQTSSSPRQFFNRNYDPACNPSSPFIWDTSIFDFTPKAAVVLNDGSAVVGGDGVETGLRKPVVKLQNPDRSLRMNIPVNFGANTIGFNYALTVLSDGTIVPAGGVLDLTTFTFSSALALVSNGMVTLTRTFKFQELPDTDSLIRAILRGRGITAGDVAVATEGVMAGGGTCTSAGQCSAALACFDSQLNPDETCGPRGVNIITARLGNSEFVKAGVPRPDGLGFYIAVDTCPPGGDCQPAVICVDNNAMVDAVNCINNGVNVIDAGLGSNTVSTIGVQADGRVVVSGNCSGPACGAPSFSACRYSDGSVNPFCTTPE